MHQQSGACTSAARILHVHEQVQVTTASESCVGVPGCCYVVAVVKFMMVKFVLVIDFEFFLVFKAEAVGIFRTFTL